MEKINQNSMEELRVFFQKIEKKVIDYIQDNQNSNTKVIEYKEPNELKELFDLQVPETSQNLDTLVEDIQKYLDYSVRTGHRQFFNQLFSGFSIPGFVGELITALTNTSMYTYEVAPVATMMERELMNKMCSLVGFPKGEGLFVTGGSNANLVATLCARNAKNKNFKSKGVYSSNPLVLFVSDQSHYSFVKAANLLGIGEENVVKVGSDNHGRMDVVDLDKKVEESIKLGKIPFFVAATAGTTVFGAFDPFEEIAKVCEKFQLWFHIDGSFGGSVILSQKHKHLLKGSQLADSFSWNPHKMMGVPLICSSILLNHKGLLTKLNFIPGTEYLFHDEEKAEYDLGHLSLQCGRRVDALKLWLIWKYYGESGFEKNIDHIFDLAEYSYQKVEKSRYLKSTHDLQSVNVCFQFIPDNNLSQDKINSFNLELRDKLCKSGKSIVNYSVIDGNPIMRLVVVNFDLEKKDIDQFFDNFETIGKELILKYNY